LPQAFAFRAFGACRQTLTTKGYLHYACLPANRVTIAAPKTMAPTLYLIETLVRLRNLTDIRRWLYNNFNDEAEWREILTEIEICPGVIVKIPNTP
jgi:hypothetical protein